MDSAVPCGPPSPRPRPSQHSAIDSAGRERYAEARQSRVRDARCACDVLRANGAAAAGLFGVAAGGTADIMGALLFPVRAGPGALSLASRRHSLYVSIRSPSWSGRGVARARATWAGRGSRHHGGDADRACMSIYHAGGEWKLWRPNRLPRAPSRFRHAGSLMESMEKTVVVRSTRRPGGVRDLADGYDRPHLAGLCRGSRSRVSWRRRRLTRRA